LSGRDNLPYVGDQNAVLDEVEEFLTGVRHGPEPDRVLATVLFTDIVGSTQRAAELGDRKWRGPLEDHDALVRRELDRARSFLFGPIPLATPYTESPSPGSRC
jgi:class 3 adenylate cyclase